MVHVIFYATILQELGLGQMPSTATPMETGDDTHNQDNVHDDTHDQDDG